MGWQQYLAENRARFMDELLTFLRFPSISSLPEHAPDVRRAAEWVSERLQTAGVEHVQILETGGHPVVYGDWLHAPGQPTVMIYGHFDTQPVDPLALWENPPFEPVVKDGRIYARGATDDKGNMFTTILAVEALLRSEGALPVNVKFFYEGQEEIGSPQLAGFVAEHKALFACDMVLSSDGGQYKDDQPALSIGYRGMCAIQIDVTGAKTDLHSGVYGGAVLNPIHALVHILDSMHGTDGHILVEGFYDEVRSITSADRAQFAAIPHDDEEYKATLGIEATFGEAGFSTLERTWARPTLEINGIWGGFQGVGTKTVLPNEAHAKITCRLVADQKPQQIAERLIAHVAKHTLPGVKATVRRLGNGSDPYLMPVEHPGNEAARAVHLELYGKEPLYVRSGGSIPVSSMFLQNLGAYMIDFAFGLDDENIHAPNEFFRVSNFERGQTAYCMLLHELAKRE